MKTFADFGILFKKTGVEVTATCPKCSAARRNKTAKCLSINTEKGVWVCHHCDWRGTLKSGEEGRRTLYTRPQWPVPPLHATTAGQIDHRGIPQEIVEQEGITCVAAYIPQLERDVPCLAFPYIKQGEVVNIKYRALEEKAFRQVAGAEKVLFRQDRIAKDCVIITEGEWDALSCVAAGFDSVVSVPDGAPAPTTKNYSSKFSYLDQDPDPFDGVAEIILAVDGDAPGHALAMELGRRLGMDRCRVVTWPEDCKDANDVLRVYGAADLRKALLSAAPFPVQDVVEVNTIAPSVTQAYFELPPRGKSTGWETVDQYYTLDPGQLTVITGIPSSGKSEWLDALVLNMATLHGWRIAICSPENMPVTLHCQKLAEKHIGKPFRAGTRERMSPNELSIGLAWLHEHVTFIVPEEVLTISGVLDRATALVRRKGIQGLVIDPFNEFDHTRLSGMTESEYIGLTLGAIKRWARKYAVHVWLVAHPQKLYRKDDGSYPVPTPYDISGSANWRNKADNCVTVWRDMNEPALPVQLHVQKVRFKHIGTVGIAELLWDRSTGRYTCPPLTPLSVVSAQEDDE